MEILLILHKFKTDIYKKERLTPVPGRKEAENAGRLTNVVKCDTLFA